MIGLLFLRLRERQRNLSVFINLKGMLMMEFPESSLAELDFLECHKGKLDRIWMMRGT